MNKKRIFISSVLSSVVIAGLVITPILVGASLKRTVTNDDYLFTEDQPPSSLPLEAETDDNYLSDEDQINEEPSKENIYPKIIDKNAKTFLPNILSYEDGEYINKDYDALPVLNNDVELQALGESVYSDINGQKVTAYSYYRFENEAKNNPNVAIGLLLYQTIQYKLLHEDEDVSVSFSSYRTSPVVAVCVVPQSRYYGYMRALYDKDYDDWGFVRISYLLVECARMGIEVNVIGQLNSYAVYQYNSSGKLVKKAEPSFVTYFNNALKGDCYSHFAPNRKVSDFMTFVKVDWNLTDKGGVDMMHLKTCISSSHIDEKGIEHHNSVFMSSSNLDSIDYRGSNGANWKQSGVAILDHKYIYRCTYNYIQLAINYSYQEGMYELKNVMNERNTEQAKIIMEGNIDSISPDELVVYPGTESDKVFECYFTPLGGHAFSWDIVNNPVCKYTSLLANSYDSVEFSISNPRTELAFDLYENMCNLLYYKFVTKKNKENRLNVFVNSFDSSGFNNLVVGRDIAFKKTTNDGNMHAKDMMYSYVDNDTNERQFISLLTSCNFHSGAYHYQTNSFIVIHENENMSNLFYKYLGAISTRGAVLNEGLKTASDERFFTTNVIQTLPKTMSATIKLREDDLDPVQGGGALFGDNDHWSKCYDYFIDTEGHPQIFYRKTDKAGSEQTITFDNVNVAVGRFINLTITRKANSVDCYIDGELKQSIASSLSDFYTPTKRFVFNGNWRSGNRHYFRGITENIKLYSQALSYEEIVSGVNNNSLMCSFDFTQYKNRTTDLAGKVGKLQYDKMWLRDVLDPTDYDYSIAQIGDTQILSEYNQEKMEQLYSWMIDNKEKYKISFMVGMGDITNKAWSWEYEYDKEQIYKLNGEIPYILCRGDHDKLNKTNKPEPNVSVNFNDVFNDEFYPTNIDGQYQPGDLTNTYKIIELGDLTYLFLCLDVGAPDDVLDWANSVCAANRDKRIVVSTHVYLYRDGTTLDYNDAYCPKQASGYNSGEQIWQKLVSCNDNIDYVLCGHDPCDVVIIRESVNGEDHVVRQILSNQQDTDSHIGPTGMVTLHFFRKDGTLVAIRNYATGFGKFGSISSNIDF